MTKVRIYLNIYIKCTDINCKSVDHYEQIDTLYSQICNVLRQSSIESGG